MRSLERRWRETAAEHDLAMLLVARLRAGQLSNERIAVASYLGHGAATEVVNMLPQIGLLAGANAISWWIQQREDRAGHSLKEFWEIPFVGDVSYPQHAPLGNLAWVAWANFFSRCAQSTRVRAALAALRGLPLLWRLRAGDDSLSRPLSAAETWLADPATEHLRRLVASVEQLVALEGLPFRASGADPCAHSAVFALRAVSQLQPLVHDDADGFGPLENLFRYAAYAYSTERHANEDDYHMPDVATVLASLTAEVVPWAVGDR